MATGLLIFAGYEFCHCVQHLPFTPRNRWLREIKKHHLAHHFHSEQGNFGITLDIWDRILGTGYDSPRAVPRSATTHNLGYDEAEREPLSLGRRALGQRRRVRGPAHQAGRVAQHLRPGAQGGPGRSAGGRKRSQTAAKDEGRRGLGRLRLPGLDLLRCRVELDEFAGVRVGEQPVA